MADGTRVHVRPLAVSALAEVPRILALAVPIVVGLASGTLIGLVDTIMVSGLGTQALAALGLATSALIIAYSGVFGLLSVTGVLLARAAGAQDRPGFSTTLADGVLMATVLGLVVGGLMLAAFPAFVWLGVEARILSHLWPYWLCMAVSLVPYATFGLYRGAFNALGNPWLPVWISLFGVGLNVPLNWVLIYGAGPLPGLGLIGAGLASLAAKTAALALIWLVWRRRMTRMGQLPARPTVFGALNQFQKGWPAAMASVGEGGAYATAGMMMAVFGVNALAANQVVHSIASAMYMLPMGMAAAVSIRVGQVVGADPSNSVKHVGLSASLVILVWMASITAVLLVFRTELAGWLSSDISVVPLVATMFLALAFTQFADGLQSTAQGALRGMLDIRLPTAITLAASWLVALPLAWLLSVHAGLGPVGIWVGYGTGVLAAALVLQARFLRRA